MAKLFHAKIDKLEYHKARIEFLYLFGVAMSHWASLEASLCEWFQRASGMNSQMATTVFFSGTGFRSRAEMLEAVLEHTPRKRVSEEQKTFLKAAIKKARQFSTFRNRIAHGEPRMRLGPKTDGKNDVTFVFYPSKDRLDATAEILEQSGLEIAINNIHTLHRCITEMSPWVRTRVKKIRSREECLAQVLALPNQANEKSDPTAGAPGPQPQGPQHRNKKAYRAEQAAKRASKKK